MRKLGEEGLLLDQNLKIAKNQNKKNMDDLRTIQEIKMQQTFRKYDDILTTKKEHNKEKIGAENKSFKEKFLHLKSTHKELLDRVAKKFNNQIEELRASHSKFKKTFENQSKDKFYQIKRLEPRVEEKGKEYFIFLKVPYHERESVHITGHNRSVRLTLARRFEDRLAHDDGTFDHSKKSEIFSKIIKMKDILDQNSITQKYENGHLIFKIRKK
jgi:HSP20 family molecular chaperone IbpA